MTRIPSARIAAGLAVLALGLAGCAAPMTASGDGDPTSAPPPATAAPEPTPTVTATAADPEPTGAPEPTEAEDATPTGVPEPTATADAAEEHAVRIGNDDFGVLDWSVTCSGLDSAPTITATAADAQGNDYVAMLLASTSGELISFTFTWGPRGGGQASKSGLSVTPVTNQGAGTFLVADRLVTSEGRGVSYGPFDKDLSVDTSYAVEFVCPSD
ncbi:MAG: hypothetical protein GXX90_01025 [Microbacteriaceae bacterium]|nr:hypothetical protein [Microbacteriaceae bacterium]